MEMNYGNDNVDPRRQTERLLAGMPNNADTG